MNLSGGRIKDNASKYKYGGMFVNHCDLSLSSNPVITDNTTKEEDSDLYLFDGQMITVTGELGSDALIGVNMPYDNAGVFTEDLSGKGTVGNFFSNLLGYEVTVSESGEAQLTRLTGPQFGKHALLLSGEIGVKFRVSFPNGFDGTNCYVDFRAADGRSSRVNFADVEKIEGSTDRYFNFFINALELSEDITATIRGR